MSRKQDSYFILYDKQDRPYMYFDNINELCEKMEYKSLETAYQTFSRYTTKNNTPINEFKNEDGTITYSRLVFYFQPRGDNPRWNKGKYRGFSLYKFWEVGEK